MANNDLTALRKRLRTECVGAEDSEFIDPSEVWALLDYADAADQQVERLTAERDEARRMLAVLHNVANDVAPHSHHVGNSLEREFSCTRAQIIAGRRRG